MRALERVADKALQLGEAALGSYRSHSSSYWASRGPSCIFVNAHLHRTIYMSVEEQGLRQGVHGALDALQMVHPCCAGEADIAADVLRAQGG